MLKHEGTQYAKKPFNCSCCDKVFGYSNENKQDTKVHEKNHIAAHHVTMNLWSYMQEY